MPEQLMIPKKPLAMAMLIGICGDASLAALTNSILVALLVVSIALTLSVLAGIAVKPAG